MFETIFDLETKKFFDDIGESDPSKLGVSIVSLYFRELDGDFKEISGTMMSFWESEFNQMWKYFYDSQRIIGFNTVRFDVPALRPYAPKDFARLPHFDILEKLKLESGHRASLNKIAIDTLGDSKIDHGANAIEYWNKGDEVSLGLLKKYCEYDVVLTKNIYDFGSQNKYLKFTDHWNNPRTVTIDFSYPTDFAPEAKQTSLF